MLGNDHFYENNILFRFCLELDKFGVDIQVLKEAIFQREFVGWIEEWEKDLNKKNGPVVKACFLTQHENLSFS